MNIILDNGNKYFLEQIGSNKFRVTRAEHDGSLVEHIQMGIINISFDLGSIEPGSTVLEEDAVEIIGKLITKRPG